VDVGGVTGGVADDRAQLPRNAAKHTGQPLAIFAVRERVLLQERLDRVIDQDQVDVGLGDQRAHEGPVARQVEVLGGAARVPAPAVVVKVGDVHVAARLVRDVRARGPAVLAADVAQGERRRAGVLLVHLAQRLTQEIERFLGGPRAARADRLV
jgi:hypothetical protein